MDTHKNARLTPKGREQMVRDVVDGGLTKAAAARAHKVSWKTVNKWVERFRTEGVSGLIDRSSRPHFLPSQTDLATREAIATMRRERCTQEHIARLCAVSVATVSRVLRQYGLARLRDIEPQEPRPRYERDRPGELIHFDIKKLGRFHKAGHRVTGLETGYSRSVGAGYEFAHIAIDDHSRVARIDIFPDEKKESAIEALRRTVDYFESLGITVTRVMTDNGSCYRSKAFAQACRELRIKHIFTKPYTPQTNGKAERFIQTAMREWAYATAYETSQQRRADLPKWLHRYNWHRPHASLSKKPPFSRTPLDRNNLMRLHS